MSSDNSEQQLVLDAPDGFDPQLRAAMAEIVEILDKYDCGGFVSLASQTHSEYRLHMPAWSIAQWCMAENGQVGIHFLHKGPDPKGLVASSVHFLLTVRDQCGKFFMELNDVYEQLKKTGAVDIDHRVQAVVEQHPTV